MYHDHAHTVDGIFKFLSISTHKLYFEDEDEEEESSLIEGLDMVNHLRYKIIKKTSEKKNEITNLQFYLRTSQMKDEASW